MKFGRRVRLCWRWSPEEGLDLDALLAHVERKWLIAALESTDGRCRAERLRITFRSFRYRLVKHNRIVFVTRYEVLFAMSDQNWFIDG